MKKMFGFWLLIAAVGIICTLAVAAFAADPAAPAVVDSAPAALAEFLRTTLFPIIGSLFLGIVGVFVNRLGHKYKIDALIQKDNFLTQLAFQGVTMAEEKAAQLVGSKSALTGNDKMDLAIGHILSIMPQISPERAKAITEATLAQIPGVGATGNQAFQLGPIFSAITGLSAETPAVPAAAAAA